MPICESAGGSQRTLGPGTDGRENAECRWLRPVLVADFEFVEWTPDNHLRHVSFVALRKDKDARGVRRQA
jgi:ATP-dependent DNA ligase